MDAVGRGRTGTSDEYVRTSKTLVLETQRLVARTLRERRSLQDPVGEGQLLADIGSYLVGRGIDQETVAAQVQRLRYFRAGGPAAAPAKAVPVEVLSEEDDEARLTMPYFIVTSRRAKVRRLHRAGGCSTRPGIDAPNFEEFASLPVSSRYTALCRTCWRGGPPGEDAVRAREAASSSGSSESSSSAPTADSESGSPGDSGAE